MDNLISDNMQHEKVRLEILPYDDVAYKTEHHAPGSANAKRVAVSLIVKAHETNAHKIAVVSWDSENTTYGAARLIAMSVSEQLDRKCVLVLTEGIRIDRHVHRYFDEITLPEVEFQSSSGSSKATLKELERSYPVQILVGPALNAWNKASTVKIDLIQSADAFVLTVPTQGLSRQAVQEILRMQKTYGIKWLGMIAVQQ